MFLIGVSFSHTAWGYPIEDFNGIGLDEANALSRSINETVNGLIPIDLFKSLGNGFAGSELSASGTSINLINWDSFSGGDIGSVLRAIAILFLQITITSIGVVLGIFRLLLDLLSVKA
jgi:hypothetical protein